MKATRNTGKEWSSRDIKELQNMARHNTTTRVIGLKLGRTENAVRSKASDMSISLRQRCLHLLALLPIICICFPAFGQRFIDELPNIAALKARNVANLNKSVFVRDFAVLGDGGGGLFVITNSSILVDEIFRVASTQNPAWSYDRKFSGPVDLRWGGAVGDDSAPDNAKIAAVRSAAAAKGYGVVEANFVNGKPSLTLNTGGADHVRLDPTALDGITPFRLSSLWTHTTGNLLEVANSGTNRFVVEDDGTLQISTATNRLGASSGNLVYSTSGSTTAFKVTNGTDTATMGIASGQPYFEGENSGDALQPTFSFGSQDGYYHGAGMHIWLEDGVQILRLLYNNSPFSGAGSLSLGAGAIYFGGSPLNLTNSISSGYGTPEGVLAQASGSLYLNREGGASTSVYVKESGTGNTGWVPMAAAVGTSGFNFGPQFDVSFNTNVNLAVGLSTTNQAFFGNVIAPAVNLGSISGALGIDAAASLEFTALLAGDATITLTNFNDFHPVSIMFTNAGNFSITWVAVDNMYWMPNGNSTQRTNDWGVGIINRFTFWKSGGRIIASDKEGIGGGAGAVGSNPTASVGLTAVNGSAGTFIRSDAAPPLSQSIAPTWTALHTWLGDGINMVRFHSTAATNAGANLSVPFRFQDADLNFYEAAKINIAKPTTWDGTAAARDGLFQVYVTIDNVSKNLFQLYSFANSGLPVAWFPELSTDLIYGNQSVLATTATRGFLYLTTCAGTPTGIPLFSGAGSVPLVFDTTNNKLYGYDGGWIDLTAGGAGTVTSFSAGNLSPLFTTSVATPTTTPALTFTLSTQTANLVYAGPTSGGAAAPSFRSLVAADLTGALGTPVSIANGGTGTNTLGTFLGNIPFLNSTTNRLQVDDGNFVYDPSSRILEVLHPTTTTQPHFLALNADTSALLNIFADRLYVANADLTLDVFNTSRSIFFTNNSVRVLELTPEWSTVIGDGTTTTSRTNKLLYIPTFAGKPTGVPAVETGRVAMGYDTVSSKLYTYNAGWKNVGGSGIVRLPISQATLPTTAPARLDYVSTTGLKRLLFATNETCYFQFTMPQDYGIDPVLRIPYSCSGAITNSASFSVSVWAQTPGDALDADTESYDTANVGTGTVPGTLNFPQVVTVTLTTNDSMAAGDTVAIRITSTTLAALNDLRVRGDMVLEYTKQ